MDKFKKFYGKVWLGEDTDKLIFNYLIANPKITAKNLANVRLRARKKYNSATEYKIASPTVAKMYIDIFRRNKDD